ncbi:hypothetical protein [Clostridium baratii]|uniref:Uncharacterized protein n=1 Tax=Clostridium baratii TaxID=1561 RepID=A0A174V6F6_9CLOT|nr:hypothetical protein [Clostridium baratii]CUQ30334.1 Uncharacterised protein [Clostridium baratii]
MELSGNLAILKKIKNETTVEAIVIGGDKVIFLNATKEYIEDLKKENLEEETFIVSYNKKTLEIE